MKSIKMSGWTISLDYDEVWLEAPGPRGDESTLNYLRENGGELPHYGTVVPERVYERAFQFEEECGLAVLEGTDDNNPWTNLV